MKVVEITKDLQLIEPDYEGISKVILAFVDLYKVANNKEIVDDCLHSIMITTYRLDYTIDTSKSKISEFSRSELLKISKEMDKSRIKNENKINQ